jgi:hypothetical protein
MKIGQRDTVEVINYFYLFHIIVSAVLNRKTKTQNKLNTKYKEAL